MNNPLKNINQLLGLAAQFSFQVPIDDKASHDYSANFDAQNTFVFGLQSDDTVRTGLIVKDLGNLGITLFAPFAGLLNWFSFDIEEAKKIYGLNLQLLPAESLLLRTKLPQDSMPLTNVFIYPVDKQKVEQRMQAVLKSQKISGSVITAKLAEFFKEESSGIYIQSGDCIGESDSKAMVDMDFQITFSNPVGANINPLYLLWLFWSGSKTKQGTFKTDSHKLTKALGLANLDLTVNKEGEVSDKKTGALHGEYQIYE